MATATKAIAGAAHQAGATTIAATATSAPVVVARTANRLSSRRPATRHPSAATIADAVAPSKASAATMPSLGVRCSAGSATTEIESTATWIASLRRQSLRHTR